MGAFALLGKHCPTGLALILARYNKDPGQKQQALGEVIATGRTLAPAYLAKLTRRADGKAITSDDVVNTFAIGRIMGWSDWTYLSEVKKIDDKNLEVSGDFTLHGVTKPLTVQVRIYGPADTAAGKRLGAGTEFKIDRRVFGVNSYADPKAVLGDEVTMRINVEGRTK